MGRILGRIQHIYNQVFKKDDKVFQIPRFINQDALLRLETVETGAGGISKNRWIVGKRVLSREELSALQAEAKQFSESYLWKLMRRDIHYIAYLQSTAKRHTEKDALYGSAMYQNLEILENFIEKCKTL